MRTKYINKVNIDIYNNNTLVPYNEKSNIVKTKQIHDKNNIKILNVNEGYSSITEKVDLELKSKKVKINKKENKTPIIDIKKYINKSISELEQKNVDKNKNNNLNDDSININKTLEKNLLKKNINKKKSKIEEYSVNSCINIKTNNYLKTPNKINNNTKLNNNIQTSHKNIYNNERNINNRSLYGKKSNYLNNSTSDKFTCYKHYSKNKPTKNSSNIIYNNSKYDETIIKDESKIIFSSNIKRDYSRINKKNNITTIALSQKNKMKTNNIMTGNKLYDSTKFFLSNKKKKQKLNSLNISLNKSTSDYPNQIKNQIYLIGAKKRKQTEYKIDNTIYELNCNKNKNRIRLNYYPNNRYESTIGDDHNKKNRLNKSVTLGKTDENKMTRLSIYMNNYNKKQRTKRISNMESSVLTNRNIHSNTIRDLSYSPNQKYLNEKTRKGRIPWKYQKKGIDSKLTTESIYTKYLTRMNKNPLYINGNKKIKIQKKKNIINENINNYITISSSIPEKTEKRRLSQEKRGRRINNHHQRETSNSNRNIQDKNKISTKKLNISISTKTKNKINNIEHIISNKKNNNNNFNIFDLSCLMIKEKSIKECSQNIITKLKKNGFIVFSNKINEIKCSKNKMNCEINICKIKNDTSDKNIFYYKINNKRTETLNNKIISKIISFS